MTKFKGISNKKKNSKQSSLIDIKVLINVLQFDKIVLNFIHIMFVTLKTEMNNLPL